MKIALFGVKYNDNLNTFRKHMKRSLKKYNHKLDESYFKISINAERKDPHGTLKRIENIINSNDVMVVEATDHSAGIGLITGLAISKKMPVLIAYDLNRKSNTSAILASASKGKRNVFLVEYDENNLKNAIIDFIAKSEDLLWSRFYFELNPEHGSFLDWWAEQYNKPKVEFLRERIAEEIKTNKEWIDSNKI